MLGKRLRKVRNSIHIVWSIIFVISCSENNALSDKEKYLIKLSDNCSSFNHPKDLINNILFKDVECISAGNEFSEKNVKFVKIQSKPILLDSIVFYLFYLNDQSGGTLTGYWGLTEDIVYFIPFHLRDCPIVYPIFSISGKDAIYRGIDTDSCSGKTYFDTYPYQSIVSRKDSDFEVEITVLPLEGVTITNSQHLRNASKAVFKIDFSDGIVEFGYNPNPDYTILPWAWEYVKMKFEGIDIDRIQ